MRRVGRERDTDCDRQRIGRLEPELALGEALDEARHRGLERLAIVPDRDEQELVRPVAADDVLGAEGCLQLGDDRPERFIPGFVTVCLIERAEAVDVDQRDAQPRAVGPRPFRLGRERAHERPVIERPGQRVPPAGLKEGPRLAGEPALRTPKDDEEQHSGQQRGGDRRDDHVAAEIAERAQDRRRVAPDGDDQHDRAVEPQGQVFAQEVRRTKRRARGGLGGRGIHELDLRRSALDRTIERPRRRRLAARDGGVARSNDMPVGEAQLDLEDLVLGQDGAEEALELRELGGRQPAIFDDLRAEALEREAAHRREVALDDRVQAGGGRVAADHDRLGGRGHADDHEEHAEDDPQQYRTG